MVSVIARHARVTGRVQGVFFRQWTKQQADQLAVKGWVRNCPDGSVEAHVEGDEPAVGALIGRMRRGPPAAEVAELISNPCEPAGASVFEVKRSTSPRRSS
ncbi:acylphosphatase [Sphingomonas sp. GCM10030256]|uniref:acylphosphatase n=1 Tax=Sphingomonas sp. GCM10030256 TaxID=3273427 RepID=UPI0036200FC8